MLWFKNRKKIVLTSNNSSLAPNVDSEIMKMVEDFAEKHDEVLRELAKR